MNLRLNLSDGYQVPAEQPFGDKLGAQLNVLSTRRRITWRSDDPDLRGKSQQKLSRAPVCCPTK